MVSSWVRGRGLWKGGGLVSNWVKFGRELRAVVKGIAGGKELGFRSGVQGVSGKIQVVSWGGMAGKCWRKKIRCWVRFRKQWGEVWRLGVVLGYWNRRRRIC